MFKTYETELAGRKLVIETGKLAGLSNGSVLVRYGDTVVMVNVTASKEPREGIDFFPLSVDFEESVKDAKKGDFVERLVFTEKPVIDGNRVTAAGAVLTLTGVEENPTLTCQTIPQHNCWGPPYDVYTLDFTVTGTKFALRMEIEK